MPQKDAARWWRSTQTLNKFSVKVVGENQLADELPAQFGRLSGCIKAAATNILAGASVCGMSKNVPVRRPALVAFSPLLPKR